MKKNIFLFLLYIIFLHSLFSNDIYKQVKVFIPDRSSFQKILQTGVDLEGMDGKIGDWIKFIVNENELKTLKNLNFEIVILIDDVSKFLEERLYKGPYNALGFGYGSMGGYYTYTEVIQQLDSMKLLYPNLITSKQLIGTSIEGRAIYAVKISDNPDLNESNEPSVLFTALTHAREPQGMMTNLYYMWWLLENYGTDLEATNLVNNRQIWFIPVVNPDGYVYNQTTNPNGGGMWRKNRRNNGGSFGVDLNRNFGPYEYWDAPNGGSSTTPSSETYRGTAPFSEPETQVIRDFLIGKNFRATLNYHTYSNLLIYPYGALVRETPDSLKYREFASDMTRPNGYLYGTDLQTVNYATRGNSDDFMYDGDILNNGKIFAMTPEVGTSSDYFWPPTARILPLAQENLFANKYITYAAGSFPKIISHKIVDSTGDGYIERGESFTLNITIRNKGLDTIKNLYVDINSLNSDLNFISNQTSVSVIPPSNNHVIYFDGHLKKRATTGVYARILVNMTDLSGMSFQDTVNLVLGKMTVVFSDSANSGTGNWNTGLGWGLSTNAQSEPYSFTDSPTGLYTNNTDNSLTLLNNLKIPSSTIVRLKFSAIWELEPGYDFLLVEASSNGGTTWQSVNGNYTRRGGGKGTQALTSFGYDRWQRSWVEDEFDLSNFASSQFKFRFRLRSDGADIFDGFYVDNIKLEYIGTDSAKYTDMAIDPVFVDFGSVLLEELRDTVIVIKNLNTSNDSLRCSVALKYNMDYSLNGPAIFTLPVGSEINLSLSFIPKSIGLLVDTLIVTHNSDMMPNPLLVPLSGSGYVFNSFKFVSKLYFQTKQNSDTLIFGALEGATANIDTALGEIELDEKPPYGVFDVRWTISETNGSKKDFRDTISNENQRNVYKLSYQLENVNDTLLIYWNKNTFASGSFVLKDSATNGFVVSVNMKKQDSVLLISQIEGPLYIIHEINPVVYLRVKKGWNLVSIPNLVENRYINYIFPGISSNAFAYHQTNGYQASDTMEIGKGYWVKFNQDREYLFVGGYIYEDTINLHKGWNLIGSISRPIARQNLITTPPGILSTNIYFYESGYHIKDSLKPGCGYWVKSADDGIIIMNANSQQKHLGKNNIDEFNYLQFIDNHGNIQKLYFTTAEITNLDYYELPPPPPSEIFDVRFLTNRILDIFSDESKKSRIKIQTNYFPVTINWKVKDNEESIWLLRVADDNGNIVNYEMGNLNFVKIENEGYTIELSKNKITDDIKKLPLEYTLEQNYPNPFNSRTQIKYQVPVVSFVTLKIYDVMGREISTLVNEKKAPGYYTVGWDVPTNIPSGVYFYRISINSLEEGIYQFQSVKKMLLMK